MAPLPPPRQLPACQRRQDVQRVARFDRGVGAAGVADVLVVQIDVDEALDLTVFAEHLALEAGEPRVDIVEDGADGAARGGDRFLATNHLLEDRGYPDLDFRRFYSHRNSPSVWTSRRMERPLLGWVLRRTLRSR